MNPDLDLELRKHKSSTLLASSAQTSGNSESLTYAAPTPTTTQEYVLTVRGKSGSWKAPTYTLSGVYPIVPSLGLRLETPSGSIVEDNKPSTGTAGAAGQRTKTISKHNIPTGTYRWVAYSADASADVALAASYPKRDFAPLSLKLMDGSETLAEVNGNTGSLSLEATAPSAGTYTWVAKNTSTTLAAPFTGQTSVTTLTDTTATGALASAGTVTHSATADGPGWSVFALTWQPFAPDTYANLALRIKNASGAIIGETTSSTGSISLPATLGTSGAYSVEITEEGTSLGTPSYSLTMTTPDYREDLISLKLYDQANTLLATGAGTTTRALVANLTPGVYKLSVSASGGLSGASITGAYPQGSSLLAITYDANDHATVIDEGAARSEETLSPSGRVLRRKVIDKRTGMTLEDIAYGYDSASDSPAYTIKGTTVTTYIDGPGGMSLITEGTSSRWQHSDGRGSIIATSDDTGALTRTPPADEFGVATVPASRLGFLGAHQRYTADVVTGIIRMGVRLYDPTLGRFLQTDPVEGGSANDYDYAMGDPVNGLDLDGMCSINNKGIGARLRNARCRASRAAGRAWNASGGKVVHRVSSGAGWVRRNFSAHGLNNARKRIWHGISRNRYARGCGAGLVLGSPLVAGGPPGWAGAAGACGVGMLGAGVEQMMFG